MYSTCGNASATSAAKAMTKPFMRPLAFFKSTGASSKRTKQFTINECAWIYGSIPINKQAIKSSRQLNFVESDSNSRMKMTKESAMPNIAVRWGMITAYTGLRKVIPAVCSPGGKPAKMNNTLPIAPAILKPVRRYAKK